MCSIVLGIVELFHPSKPACMNVQVAIELYIYFPKY